MTMRTIQVQHLGSDDLEEWYSDVIPQIGETVRLLASGNCKEYRVLNVIHGLWPHVVRAVSIPIIVLTEIASEVHGATEDG